MVSPSVFSPPPVCSVCPRCPLTSQCKHSQSHRHRRFSCARMPSRRPVNNCLLADPHAHFVLNAVTRSHGCTPMASTGYRPPTAPEQIVSSRPPRPTWCPTPSHSPTANSFTAAPVFHSVLQPLSRHPTENRLLAPAGFDPRAMLQQGPQ